MWKVMGKNISMAEGDFGIALPARAIGITLTDADTVVFVFKNQMNGATVLEKEAEISSNIVTITFTETESELFPVGQYVYRVDWYQNGLFMCNIIPAGIFKVVDKA